MFTPQNVGSFYRDGQFKVWRLISCDGKTCSLEEVGKARGCGGNIGSPTVSGFIEITDKETQSLLTNMYKQIFHPLVK